METLMTKSDLLIINSKSYQFEVAIVGETSLQVKVKNMSSNKSYKHLYTMQGLKLLCPIFFNKNEIEAVYDLFVDKLEKSSCDIEENKDDLDFITLYLLFTLDGEKCRSPLILKMVKKEKASKKRIKLLDDLQLKKARREDVGLIFNFIKELADYEKASDKVYSTEEILLDSLFGEKQYAECVIAYLNDKAVAFALYFHNYSTWTGRPGLYLEDVFVKPEFRGKGIGKNILVYLAKLAKERNCSRFEWSVLDWNEPSIEFYKSLDALPMDEWTVFRLEGENLNALAENK